MSFHSNSIVQGDSVELLKQLDPGSVDLVFADPPFNIGYQYDVYEDSRKCEEYLEWCRDWIGSVYRALSPTGTFWLAIGDEYAAELKIEAQRAGFTCRSWVIWYYTFGVNCVNGFSRSHTHLFHFVKDPKKFTFNRHNPQIRVKSARQLVYGDNRANPDGRLPDNTWIIRPQDAPLSFSPNHDTWYFARVAGTFKEREGFHGCQMPEQLLARIIRSSSNPQDLVLDPFGGSGTTLSVAKKLGRRFLGFELSSEYAKFIGQRLEQTEVGDAIDGPEDPIESAPSTAKGKRRKKSTDDKADKALIAAYKKAGQGYPADHLLCDPELNQAFVDECRKKGIAGTPYVWNRFLLQLRKASKLPRSTCKAPQLSSEQMERLGYASEVAWRLIAIDYQKTLDEILCSPDFAAEFDRLAKQYGPDDEVSSVDYRRAAVSLRKRSNKARKTAFGEYEDWINHDENPQRIKVGDSMEALDLPGVFVLHAEDSAVFAGESGNIKNRINQMLENEKWSSLKIDTIDFVPHKGNLASRYALKAALAIREHPLLNCRLLMYVSEIPRRGAKHPAHA